MSLPLYYLGNEALVLKSKKSGLDQGIMGSEKRKKRVIGKNFSWWGS